MNPDLVLGIKNEMEKLKSIVAGVRSGLGLIWGGIVRGVLVGSVVALLLPTVASLGPLFAQQVRSFPATKLGQWLEPWLNAVVAPARLWLVILIAVLAVGYLSRESLWQFLQRCYSWSIHDPTLLWATYSFFCPTRSPLSESKITTPVTTPVLGWLEDSVVRSDSPDFGVAEPFSTCADTWIVC